MKHLLLKFNHGIEIGARLAYLGHYRATKDENVYNIAFDELAHKNKLIDILRFYDEEPSFIFDSFFTIIGTIINLLCSISPKFLLNLVATRMETFAIFSYKKLAKKYPLFGHILIQMAHKEEEHKNYFRGML